MLPEGWNATGDLYVLRYRNTDTSAVHILKIIAVDGMLLVHLWVSEHISKLSPCIP